MDKNDNDKVGLITYDLNNVNNDLLQNSKEPKINLNKKNYTPINSYKPSGNLVYDDSLLNTLENKFKS